MQDSYLQLYEMQKSKKFNLSVFFYIIGIGISR